jgi:hypothetical protein
VTREVVSTPLLEVFRHGGVDREIRLMAAQGTFGLSAPEQLAVCELLARDSDTEVARAAAATLRELNRAAGAPEAASPAPAPPDAASPEEEETDRTALQRIASMTPAQRLARAIKGTREERTILVRDPNRVVAVAVLSSPKITETEIESIAKMANVSDEILRIIGNTRTWTKSYAVVTALVRNAKTPVGVSMTLLHRLMERDVKALSVDRNIPEVLRVAARKKITDSKLNR